MIILLVLQMQLTADRRSNLVILELLKGALILLVALAQDVLLEAVDSCNQC